MIPALFTSSLLGNLAFLLVNFTDDTKIHGVIKTKDTERCGSLSSKAQLNKTHFNRANKS